LAEHDRDCGRAFLPDDINQPLYAGFADYLEIPPAGAGVVVVVVIAGEVMVVVDGI
jgi:hypothetical protein